MSVIEARTLISLRFCATPAKTAPRTVPVEANCSTATIYDEPTCFVALIKLTPHDGNPVCIAKLPKARP